VQDGQLEHVVDHYRQREARGAEDQKLHCFSMRDQRGPDCGWSKVEHLLAC
jgi:hypothetical protein